MIFKGQGPNKSIAVVPRVLATASNRVHRSAWRWLSTICRNRRERRSGTAEEALIWRERSSDSVLPAMGHSFQLRQLVQAGKRMKAHDGIAPQFAQQPIHE